MISDSNKIPYMIKYEISPLIVPKIVQFNEISNSSMFKIRNYSENKNNQNEKEGKISVNSNKNFKGISSENKFNSFDPSFTTVSSFNKSKNNSLLNTQINFQSKIFGNFNKSQNHFMKRKKMRLKRISQMKRQFILINEVNIHDFHLINFPLINIDNEEIKVSLLSKLILSQKYFIINKPPLLDLCPYKDESLKTLNIPLSILKNNNLYYYEGVSNAFKIIMNYYLDIKNCLILIEKNFINKTKKIYNEKNLLKLELLIRNCNMFTSFILQKFKNRMNISKIILNKNGKEEKEEKKIVLAKNEFQGKKRLNSVKKIQKLKKIKLNNNNCFKCDFCNKIFKNGQALGGHLSQSHPRQSEKYKMKIMIRNKRKDRRDLIANCRKYLIEKYGFDYDSLLKDPKKKIIIKKIIKEHKLEYKKLLLKKKKEN